MVKTRLHLIFLLSAVMIAVLLGIHMVVLHLEGIMSLFGGSEVHATDWEPMIGRSMQGLWTALYIALLAFGLYHGLYGLRGIIIEVTTSAKTLRFINWLFIIIGVVVFVWGSYVPIALLSS
jgi:succinate dehydrogenase hydrophobic anchor subunit